MYEDINDTNFVFQNQLLLVKDRQNQMEENELNYLPKKKKV